MIVIIKLAKPQPGTARETTGSFGAFLGASVSFAKQAGFNYLFRSHMWVFEN